MKKRFFKVMFCVCLVFGQLAFALVPYNPPAGGEYYDVLSSPENIGTGLSITGGAFGMQLPGAAALNPALSGDEQRIVLNLGYSILKDIKDKGLGHTGAIGVTVPTRWSVISASLGFLSSKQDSLYLGTSGNFDLSFSKDLFENLYVGIGLHSAFGSDWALSGELGFVYFAGDWGFVKDIRLAGVLSGLGKGFSPDGAKGLNEEKSLSSLPSFLTPRIGLSGVLFSMKGFAIGSWVDVAAPSIQNVIVSPGLQFVWNDTVTLNTTWDFNFRETVAGKSQFFPAFGLCVNIKLNQPEDESFLGRNGWNKSELTPSITARPITKDVWAFGGNLNVHLGLKDEQPPEIKINYPEKYYFSPNNDGIEDELLFDLAILDSRYIKAWAFIVEDANGRVVRRIENKETRTENETFKTVMKKFVTPKQGIQVPDVIRWDGTTDTGEVAPDGIYYFRIESVDDNGNESVSPVYEVELDNTNPEIKLFGFLNDVQNEHFYNENYFAGTSSVASSAAVYISNIVGQVSSRSIPDPETKPTVDLIFSPDGDGHKDTFTIPQKGTVEPLWTGTFYSSSGTAVRTYEWKNSEPSNVSWDGKDDNGIVVPDGVYSYEIVATDKAGNKTSAKVSNIIVNTEKPAINLTIGYNFFSPGTSSATKTIPVTPSVPVTSGLLSWQIEIQNTTGEVVKTFEGKGSAPKSFEYDGKDSSGAVLKEGEYQAVLTVYYENGYQPNSRSPIFTVDVTPPSAKVTSNTNIFSPNGDGKLDVVKFEQTASNEDLWSGVLKTSGGRAVKTWTWNGQVPESIEWNGLDGENLLLADGMYTYELTCTDKAGNKGSSSPVSIVLNTEETEVMIHPGFQAFSPNGDKVQDSLQLNMVNKAKTPVKQYSVVIVSDKGTKVAEWTGNSSMPNSVTWNGKTLEKENAPDGIYEAKLEVTYANGNVATSVSPKFALDTKFPDGSVSSDFTAFSPNGDSVRDTIKFTQTGVAGDEWSGAIYPVGKQTAVKTFVWKNIPETFIWNGTDEAGNSVPDGKYRYVLESTDVAGNKTQKTIENLVVDTRVPKVFITASLAGISPNGDGVKDVQTLTPIATISDGIESWELQVVSDLQKEETKKKNSKDASPVVYRTWKNDDTSKVIPKSIAWDGKDTSEKVVSGSCIAKFTITYEKGDVVVAESAPFMVNAVAPVLSVQLSPKYFSPDNDGVDDELSISLEAKTISNIASWSFDVREPQGTSAVFWKVGGNGTISPRVIWDGRSNKGELVQAATDYPYTFTVTDDLGNISVLQGYIPVDVLVIREGDALKIKVPSIIFRGNYADFIDLPEETVKKNNQVLKRVAEILNKFKDYRVTIEGHANNTTGTQREEDNVLLPLSQKRAEAVKKILKDYGVNDSRLSTVGVGGTKPVVSRSDKDNWWKNRRVEFILVK